jgi:hypothetical protein
MNLEPVPTPPAVPRANAVVAVIVLLSAIVCVAVVVRMDPWGESRTEQPMVPIDPALIKYRQSGEIPVAMAEVRGLAVGPEDRIYVAGDRAIRVFDADGTARSKIALSGPPRCLAVGGAEHASPGRIYVGMSDHVELIDPSGAPAGRWPSLGQQALITSIAAAEKEVFVADAGNRIVCHYNADGQLQGKIGARDHARRIPGFVITSPYFDLAVGHDGLLYVVNPRALRLEAYTFQGDLELTWGKGSPEIDGFFGCCNPAHFAILADGRFVTAEKGIPRIKVYTPQGEFSCVVAGPEQMAVPAADVATDSHERVLVLDPAAKSVRIFTPKEQNPLSLRERARVRGIASKRSYSVSRDVVFPHPNPLPEGEGT